MRSTPQFQTNVASRAATENIKSQHVADTVVEADVRLELPRVQCQLFVVNADDNVSGAEAGLPRFSGDERAKPHRQPFGEEAELPFLVRAEIVTRHRRRRPQ